MNFQNFVDKSKSDNLNCGNVDTFDSLLIEKQLNVSSLIINFTEIKLYLYHLDLSHAQTSST